MAQINKPSDYFNTKLYTGTGSSQSITGVGFQPDWVWIKNRTDVSNHNLYDSVRGGNGTSHYWLKSNSNVAEGTNTGSLLTLDSDGFTLGDGNEVNGSGDNMVSWNWLANGAGSSNTSGTITSTVSANTTAGFSIVSYTGTGANATVGHGLGAIPRMIIVKRRDGSDSWVIQHGSLGASKALNLDSTGAVQTYDPYWNATEPTTSVFSIGTDGRTNGSTETYIAYCFAEKKGYSKFGSYTGNGNDDGTFSFCGFKPSFVLTKRTDSAGSWVIQDNKRPGYNETSLDLNPNNSEAEEGNNGIDMCANGFKQRNTDAHTNASGGTYIYMAFAEEPLVGTNNIPATAR